MSVSEKAETPTPAGSIARILNRCMTSLSDWWAREMAVQKVKRRLKTVPGELVREVLAIKFKNANIYVSDVWKEAPRWEDFLGWLKADSLSEKRWIEDEFDCDNFALESKCRAERRIVGNIAYGFVWYAKPAHAANVLVCYTGSSLKPIQIEPQVDGVSKYRSSEAYLVVM